MENKHLKMSPVARFMSNVKIGQRFMVSMMSILTILVTMIILLLTQSTGYQQSYNRLLDNLNDISYIIQETETQGNRILDYFTMEKNIADSGEAEIIVQMLYRINNIRENIGTDERYKENQETLKIVENLLNNYAQDFKNGAGKCGEKYSMAGDSDFYSMVDTAGYIVENCNKLQALEMNRSENLKNEISDGYEKLLIVVSSIIFIVVFLTIMFIYSVTESITYPLGILMSHISDVSKSGLLDEDKLLEGTDKNKNSSNGEETNP